MIKYTKVADNLVIRTKVRSREKKSCIHIRKHDSESNKLSSSNFSRLNDINNYVTDCVKLEKLSLELEKEFDDIKRELSIH